jgi:type IV secretion system protein VirD4
MAPENEFLRNKPKTPKGFAFSLAHKIIPIGIAFLGVFFSSQYCAYQFSYDPQRIGMPVFVLFNSYPVYSPLLVFFLIGSYFSSGDAEAERYVLTAAYILTGTSFFAVFVYFFLTWTRNTFFKNENVYGTARFAKKEDLQASGLLNSCGVVLGQLDSAKVTASIDGQDVKLTVKKIAPLVQHMMRASTLMLAPTRSGKGVSSVVPTLLSYPHSIITIDPKGENWEITAGYRNKFSYTWKHSPVSSDTLRFNILDEISEDHWFRDASMIADILVTPSDGRVDGNAKHWIDTARDLLTGVILHVKCSDYHDKSLHGALSFLSKAVGENNEDDKGAALFKSMISSHHCNSTVHETVSNVARRNLARPDNERGSVISTAVTALQVFEDPHVRDATKASDFCLDDFLYSKYPISWYITCPFSDLSRLSSYMRLVITFVLRKFSQADVSFRTQKLAHPILFLIDEFPTLGYMPVLEEMMGILAGYGITFFLICQSPTQIHKLYGEKSPIFDHCRFIATYATSDVQSSEMFSKMAGVDTATFGSLSNSGSRYDYGMTNLNVSNQTVQRNLLNADEIQHLPANRVLVFGQGMPVAYCKKTAYYQDPRFKKKAYLPVPKVRAELLAECADSVKPSDSSMQWFEVQDSAYYSTREVEVVAEMKCDLPSDEELSVKQKGAML